jgi:hypothetical protein
VIAAWTTGAAASSANIPEYMHGTAWRAPSPTEPAGGYSTDAHGLAKRIAEERLAAVSIAITDPSRVRRG